MVAGKLAHLGLEPRVRGVLNLCYTNNQNSKKLSSQTFVAVSCVPENIPAENINSFLCVGHVVLLHNKLFQQ